MRGGDKARVVPFSVIANSKIQNVDIFKAVSWRNVEKKKPLSTTNSTTSSHTESTNVSDCSITASVANHATYMPINSPGVCE